MPMYKLTPTFPSGFDVAPKKICYGISSYHHNDEAQQSSNSTVETETDPVKILEQKQQALIEKLKIQAESLNKLLAVFGKTAEPKKNEKPATQQKAAPATAEPKDAKKDKDAKKEARKAAKASAINKVGNAPQAGSKKGPASAGSNNNVWTVQDDRKTWTTGNSLTANKDVSLESCVENPEYTNVTLVITNKDQKWVKALAAAGEKRKIAFTGAVSNKVGKDAKAKFTIESGSSFAIKFQDASFENRTIAWDVIGKILGLTSNAPEHTLSSAHQGIWLEKCEKIIDGAEDIGLAVREASQFLARFDSLSSQWDITAADIVFRSLLDDSLSYPNNVEIWVKRVDSVLAA